MSLEEQGAPNVCPAHAGIARFRDRAALTSAGGGHVVRDEHVGDLRLQLQSELVLGRNVLVGHQVAVFEDGERNVGRLVDVDREGVHAVVGRLVLDGGVGTFAMYLRSRLRKPAGGEAASFVVLPRRASDGANRLAPSIR